MNRFFCNGKKDFCDDSSKCAKCEYRNGGGGFWENDINDVLTYCFGEDQDLERLRELAQADREGRCVVLPCKVGDTVYILTRTGVTEREIVQIEMMHDIEFYAVDYVRGETSVFFFPNDIGQTVFLTREEAQAKLKERCAK